MSDIHDLEQKREEAAAIQQTMREFTFGLDVEAFLKTDIGRYLVQRAEAEREQAASNLIEADPSDTKAITALQLKARVADRIQAWLADAIQNGRNAETKMLAEEAGG